MNLINWNDVLRILPFALKENYDSELAKKIIEKKKFKKEINSQIIAI